MAEPAQRKYYPGTHKVICDVCGLTYLRSECRLQWNNLLACGDCFDSKNPQLNIRGYVDKQSVDIARPEPENDADLTFYTPTSGDEL